MTRAPPPFRVQRRAGLLLLELDTPGSPVNILTPQAAAQLKEIVEALPQAGVDALVVKSAKPGSFVNGASLLLAGAPSTPAQVRRISRPVREAYAALARAPVTTLAVIEGNCFGCGLELALCCDVRIARDTYEAQFYMTELSDYRLIPIFGGTQRLPRALGAQAAIDLLLRGQRWDAATAHARGLVDVLLPSSGFDEQLWPSIERLRASGAPRRPVSMKAAGRLGALLREVPPPRQQLWARCAELIRLAGSAPLRTGLAKELGASAESVASVAAKRAMSFFFLRHMARSAALGHAGRAPCRVRLAVGHERSLAPLADVLAARPLAFAPARELGVRSRPRGRGQLGALLGVQRRPEQKGGGLWLYLPAGASGSVVCELALSGAGLPLAREVASYLDWTGFEPVLTRPGGDFASNRLIARYLAELAGLVRAGAPAAAVNRALWEAGFEAMPADLARAWAGERGARPLLELVRAADGDGLDGAVEALLGSARRAGRPARAALDVLCAGLIAEGCELLADGTLAHPAQVDVLARLLFDFPLEEGSLLQRADRLGLRALVQRAEAAGRAGDWPPSLRRRLDGERGFYRSWR